MDSPTGSRASVAASSRLSSAERSSDLIRRSSVSSCAQSGFKVLLGPLNGDFDADVDDDTEIVLDSDQTLLVEAGRPLLGTWQKIFLAEWDGPRTRTIAWRILTE